jgi:hypothetical protein
MPHSVQSSGIIIRTASIAAVLAASWIGAGTTTVQAGQLTLKFTNASKTKISIKVDKISYREDIDIGKSVTVPSTMLQNVDPKDQSIDWDAHQADLKSVQQKSPNPVCSRGKIKFDSKGTATINVKGC